MAHYGECRLDGTRCTATPAVRRTAGIVVAWLTAGALANPAPAVAQEAQGLAALHWLAGCWAGTLSNGARYEEWWMPDAGGMMLGMARMTRDQQTLSFESVRIVLDGDTPVYVAQPGGREPTLFRLTRLHDGRAVFENPAHDFPQTIIYAEPSTGAPFARIEGPRGGEVRGLDFPLTRTACAD